MRRHQLENEAKAKEDSAAPPADLREEIPRLADSDQRIGGRARSAEAGGEAAALSGLEQNGQHHHDAIGDEQDEKKRVNH